MDYSPAPRDLRRVEIHIGPLCNNKCVFCVSSQARDDRDPWARAETVKRELEHFRAQGCGAVGFLGGEPTVYPWIEECVAHAKKIGYERIALCTNGTRFSDADFCRRLVENGMSRVTISAHSHRPEVEDGMITLVPGNLEKKIAGIRNLMKLRAQGLLKDNVSLNPVLCRPTMKSMEEYLAFYCSLGIEDVRFNFIWPEGAVGEDPAWVPRFSEAMPYILRAILRNEKRPGLHLTFGGVPKCALAGAGLSDRLREHIAEKYLDEATNDPDNDVSVVSGADPGLRPPTRFVWQEMKRNMLKTRGEGCRDCRHYERCEGIWKTYVKLYGFDEFVPVRRAKSAETPRAAPEPSWLEAERYHRSLGKASKLLVVDATTRCNQECAFCFERHLHFTRPDMTIEEVRSLAEDAKAQGFACVTFIGGEITLVPWLCEAVSYIRGLGLRVGVTTNGVLLSSPRFCERLMRAGPTHVEISLLADNAGDDFRLSGLSGGFAMRMGALERIAALRRLNPAGEDFLLAINIVVNSVNAPRLYQLAALLEGRGVDRVSFKMLEITPDLKDRSLAPSPAVIAESLLPAMGRLEAAGIDFFFDRIPLCAVPERFRGHQLPREAAAGAGFSYGRSRPGERFDFATFSREEPPRSAKCAACGLRDVCSQPQQEYLNLFGDSDLRPAAAG
jgi:cyclic pyranopterin phosphate synthase